MAFASYCQEREEDKESARRIVAELRLRGFGVFHDVATFADGDSIEGVIGDALARSQVFVPYLTPQALESDPVVKLEFKQAVRLCRDNGQPKMVAVARGLGDTHQALTERTRSRLAYPFDARWTHLLHNDGNPLPLTEAARTAMRALVATFRAGEGTDEGTWNVTLATRGDRPASTQLTIDATELVGGPYPRPGTVQDWLRIHSGIGDLAAVLKAHGARRDVRLNCACHLTAALAAGFAFRHAAQWRIVTLADDGVLCARSTNRVASELLVEVEHGSQSSSVLCVEVGLLPQSIENAVDATLGETDLPRRRLRITRDSSLRMDPSTVGAVAGQVADLVKRHRAEVGAARVDLYVAIPACVGALLGAELNGVGCPVQLHEFADDRYHPTLALEAT